MGSILKRISPTSQLYRQLQKTASIHFNLDEPDSLINKKLGATPVKSRHTKNVSNIANQSFEIINNNEISFETNVSDIYKSNFSNK